jgi:hypothetical protein
MYIKINEHCQCPRAQNYTDIHLLKQPESFRHTTTNINAKSKSSLTNYAHFPIRFGKRPYLSNLLKFQLTRLQMLARMNTLSINSVLHRMKFHTTPGCEMCSSGPDEDLFHFMLDCQEYTPIRNNYFYLITERFPGLGFLELSPFSFNIDTNIGLFFLIEG